jgi:hypothetical protein
MRLHTYTIVDTYRHTHKHLHTHMHAHTNTQLHTHKPRNLANIHKHVHRRSRVSAHTHTQSSAHIRIMRMDMQWAPLVYTHCSPLTRTPSFSSADDPMTRCGGLGLRGEMATPMMRQGAWCLLPVVLNAVPIHTQCSDHYLRDEASWLSNQLQ